MKRFLPDEAATVSLAEAFAAALPAESGGLTILLSGELGAGKSTFARALIHALGHTGPVPSPTYTLVEPYEVPPHSLYHIDLYRIADEGELRYLGWTELDDGLRLVEWPERAPGLADQADLQLTLAYDGQGRSVDLEALSKRGRTLISALEATLA